MRQFIRIKYNILSTLGLLLFVVSGCNKDMAISLGSLNEDLGVAVVDSIGVTTSTVLMPHIPTAGSGILLTGKVDQVEIGTVTSSSYFRFTLQNLENDIPADAVFESAHLILRPHSSRYYYGDTTAAQKFTIHRLTEVIEPRNINTVLGANQIPVYVTGTTMFADQKFNYENASIGALTFAPNVRSLDTLKVSLNSVFASDVFTQFKEESRHVVSNLAFQDYLKGLVIVPDEGNVSVIGLNDTVSMEINYRYLGADGFMAKGTKSISTGAQSLQFNSIQADRSGTAFAALTEINRELKSSATAGNVYLQAGTGVATKLEFPSLISFLNEPNIAVNKVQLVIEAEGANFGNYPNPNGLMLLIANKYTGVPISYVRAPRSANNSIQAAQFLPGDAFGRNTRYVFDLIDYIKLLNNPVNADNCLYLTVATPNLFGTTHSVVIAKEDNQPKIKINIVYTKFR